MSFKAYVKNFYEMQDMAPVQHVLAHSRPFANAASMGYDPAGPDWTYQYFSTCEIDYGGAALIANHGPADHVFYILEGEGYESKGKVPYIEGPQGKVYKGFECTIPDVMNKLAEFPDPEPQNTDFIRCIRNRERFALDEIKGYHSSTIVNMALCALRLNRTLRFDPTTQLFIDDDAANRLIDQPMRSPWTI